MTARWGRLVLWSTAALSGLFLLWIGSPLVTGKQFIYDDFGNYYLPFRQFYANCLRNGDAPYWCPNTLSGVYLHGDGHMGMMHPLHPLLYGYLSLSTAIPLEMLFWLAVLFAGGYALFRGWDVSRPAASVGAFLLTFGGYSFLRIVHINGLAVFAHVPWLLLVAERLARETNYYRVAGWCVASALLTASQVLMGFPQHVVYSVLLEGGYLLFAASRRQRVSRGLMLISAKVIAALIGGVQILPTWSMLHQSTRAAPSLEFLAQGSLHPVNLLQWFNPYALAGRHLGGFRLHEIGIYPGIGTLLIFFWLCFHRPESEWHRRLRTFLVVAAIAGVLLALGKYNLVFPLYARLPVIAMFRDPCRYFFLASFAFAGGSALALDEFIRSRPWTSGAVRVIVTTTIALSLCTCAATLLPNGWLRTKFSSNPHILFGCAIVCIGALLFYAAARGGTAARVIFLLFVLGDVSFYYFSWIYQLRRAPDPTQGLALPPVAPPGPVYSTDHNRLMFDGYRLVNGYVGLMQTSTLGFDSPLFRRLAGSRANQGPGGWQIMPDPFARVRLLSAVIQSDDPARDGARVDLARVALASEKIDVDSGASGHAVIRADRPGKIRIETETSGRMLAALTERFGAGWTGLLDGKPISPLRVNGDFLGFAVPAGHHNIDLIFAPRDLRWGAEVSMLGLILLLIYPASAYAAQRKQARA